MAKKKKNDETRDKLLWAAGAALVGGGVMYFFNKYMKDKEELTEIRAAERLRAMKAAETTAGGE
jgi:hypothetical protein